jgi:hypothetical protein
MTLISSLPNSNRAPGPSIFRKGLKNPSSRGTLSCDTIVKDRKYAKAQKWVGTLDTLIYQINSIRQASLFGRHPYFDYIRLHT